MLDFLIYRICFALDAIEDISNHLLVDYDDGKIPQCILFEDIANGKFKMAGQLIASSIYMSGPAPSFFTSWIYRYFIGGLKHCLEHIPSTIAHRGNLPHAYNFVSFLFLLLC